MGIAQKLGRLFNVITAKLNTTHKLTLYPLTTRDTLRHMLGGEAILQEATSAKEAEVLAHNALDSVQAAGGACRGSLLGILGKPNVRGAVSTSAMMKKTGFSKS